MKSRSREYDSRLGRTSNHFRANASQRRNVRWTGTPALMRLWISIGDLAHPEPTVPPLGRAIATFRTQTSGLKIDDYNVAGQHVNRFWSKIHIALPERELAAAAWFTAPRFMRDFLELP